MRGFADVNSRVSTDSARHLAELEFILYVV